MISPTVGRVVWFYAGQYDGDIPHEKGVPLAAIVVRVWSDRMVNLTVHDHNGDTHPRTSIALKQPGDEIPAGQPYCEWMPYQLHKAGA